MLYWWVFSPKKDQNLIVTLHPLFPCFFCFYTFLLAVVGCEPHHQLTSVPGAVDRSREAGGSLGGKLRTGLPLSHRRWRAPQTGQHWRQMSCLDYRLWSWLLILVHAVHSPKPAIRSNKRNESSVPLTVPDWCNKKQGIMQLKTHCTKEDDVRLLYWRWAQQPAWWVRLWEISCSMFVSTRRGESLSAAMTKPQTPSWPSLRASSAPWETQVSASAPCQC